MSPARFDELQRAAAWADEFSRTAIAHGADPEFIDASWSELCFVAANAEAEDSLVERARTLAWQLRATARELASDLTRRPPQLPKDVFGLALPRMLNHVVDQIPLARELERGQRRMVFAAPVLGDEIEQAGFLVDRMVEPQLMGALGEFGAAAAKTLAALSAATAKCERPLQWAIIGRLSALLRPFVRYRRAARRLLDTCQPRLVLVGNPNTLEGRIGTKLALARNIRVIALQHGSIASGDPTWSRSRGVDVFVWGESSRDALIASGVAPSAAHVTGCLRLDAIGSRPPAALAGRRATILVASSGAGHQVGLEEHRRFVFSIYEAATRTPEVHWACRLHPKDSPDLYAEAAKRSPNANVEVNAAKGTDIFDALRDAMGLVTVVSTSALDAMVSNVPVISLQPSRGQRQEHEFIRSGSVKLVTSTEELVAAARELVAGKFPPAITEAAQRQRERTYANVGTATRVAADLCERLVSDRR